MTGQALEVTLSPDLLQSKAQLDEARASYLHLAHEELDRLFGEEVRHGDIQAQGDAIIVATGAMDLAPTDFPSWLRKCWDEWLLPELQELADKDRENKERNSETGDWAVDELNRTCRSQVEAGDGHAIVDAIYWAEEFGMDLPDWVLRPLADAAQAYRKGWVRTLDEALDLKRPKGFRLTTTDTRTRLGVGFDCVDLQNHGAPVDDRLFELVGALYDIGKTKAKELYYRLHPTREDARWFADLRERRRHDFQPKTALHPKPPPAALRPDLLEVLHQLRPDLAISSRQRTRVNEQ